MNSEAICAAARRGVDDLRELMASAGKEFVSWTDESGQSALHVVSSMDEACAVPCVAALLRSGGSVAACDRHGWTALHCAARHGRCAAAELLLGAGADAAARNSEGTTPLHYLVRRETHNSNSNNSNEEEQELLLRLVERMAPAALHAANAAHETPLHLAASHDGCVALLLRLGADPNALNKKGETPLHYAARSGRVAATAALLEAGSRMDLSELLEVADKSVPEVVQLLLAASQRPLNARLAIKAKPSQRRIEHVLGVHCRGLSEPASKLTLHWTSEGKPAGVFVCEQRSKNPEWEVDGVILMGCDATLAPRVHDFWVCVWNGEEELVLKRHVVLSELVCIGTELAEARFPPSSLVLELAGDGLFVKEDTAEQMRLDGGLPSVSSSLVKQMIVESYSLVEFVSLLQGAHALKEAEHERDELQKQLDRQLVEKGVVQGSKVEQGEGKAAALRLRVSRLREELVRVREAGATAKKETQTLCDSILRGRHWIGATQANLEDAERCRLPELAEQRRGVKEGSATLLSAMLAQLRDIFPVAQQQQGVWTIAGIRLPNSEFAGCDQEQIATALGYVCHVVNVVARWLGITLTYDTIPMSSRSIVKDDISVQGSGSSKFPLYARGVDRTRFEYAVFLLNKDIEQLLHSQGIEALPLKNTLPNLHRLMNMNL